MQKNDFDDLFLRALAERVQIIATEASAHFSKLDNQQLNFKPADNTWSIGQCLDHIITTNRQYFEMLKPMISGWRDKNQVRSKPFRSGLFGNFFVNSMKPNPKRKLKSPDIFLPAQSEVTKTILNDFERNLQQVLQLLQHADGADLNRIKVTSPVTRLIRFRLGDCFNVLVTHSERHTAQARGVLAAPQFPGGAV
ncbi:MAG: DinB family protein [Deferribacteres bacterium]|nr:DinB family protein [candidate division KSB1 bacterium]MCB9511141.1 DinB family protein [Deferribacteres bacterium]